MSYHLPCLSGPGWTPAARRPTSQPTPSVPMERVRAFAAANGVPGAQAVLAIGSGLHGRRQPILSWRADPTLPVRVVEHRDRLARFGVELISAALEAQGRRIVVMNDTESKDDLVQDMTNVLTALCARLSGPRGAAHRAQRALEAAEQA